MENFGSEQSALVTPIWYFNYGKIIRQIKS
jgi:hypothetical protein